MNLTLHSTATGPRWSLDSRFLTPSFTFSLLLEQPLPRMSSFLEHFVTSDLAEGASLAPIDPHQEVWASGVTYQRSREARRAESSAADFYDRVYDADRPELFFKAEGWRVMGPDQPLRIRHDSAWNVPEPELTLVINAHGEIVGYTAGNDMSSRSIEGENPLYLPQAKVYDGACALGPSIRLLELDNLRVLPVELRIQRGGGTVFEGSTSTSRMNRKMEELAAYLFRELSFPRGVFLLTGTGIVPPEQFTLAAGDMVTVTVDGLVLSNPVGS